MDVKRLFGPLLGLAVLGGVGWGLLRSFQSKRTQDQAGPRVTIRVVSGSEKLPLLKDEKLISILDRHGITLEVHKAGSREIAGLQDLRSYDVAFPAGQPAAEKIRQGTGAKSIATAFATPMVVASWKPIAEVLAAQGIVRQEGGAYWIIDMAKLLELMASGKRWRDLPQNTTFNVGKSILVSTTHVSTSNSAAQFLALASYLFNGSEVVGTPAQAEAAALKVAPLFTRQGFQESSSAGPFEDYLAIGMGKTPLVWIYESQFLEQGLQRSLSPDMVLLYPRPTLFTKHVMVALSDKGTRFLKAMEDPEAQALAASFGYRTEQRGAQETLRTQIKGKGLHLPDLVDLVDAPSYELLERMIQTLEQGKEPLP